MHAIKAQLVPATRAGAQVVAAPGPAQCRLHSAAQHRVGRLDTSAMVQRWARPLVSPNSLSNACVRVRVLALGCARSPPGLRLPLPFARTMCSSPHCRDGARAALSHQRLSSRLPASVASSKAGPACNTLRTAGPVSLKSSGEATTFTAGQPVGGQRDSVDSRGGCCGQTPPTLTQQGF